MSFAYLSRHSVDVADVLPIRIVPHIDGFTTYLLVLDELKNFAPTEVQELVHVDGFPCAYRT